MSDVARVAGVSVKTVSRVVNDEPRVDPLTAARVSQAIAALGFRRNDGARQLRTGKTSSIGLIVEDLADPFYSALAKAVAVVAQQHDHLLFTVSAEGSPEREHSLLSALLSRRVDGLIVVPAGIDDHGWLAAENVPCVFVDRPGTGMATDTVLTDNTGGIASAVDHLVATGHRRIGFLGDDPGFWTAQRRREGFLMAAESRRIRDDRLIAMGPHDTDSIGRVWASWLRGPDPVTAVVTGNNRVTVSAVRALRLVRARLALVGFDDFELADLLQPPVTVVAQDPAALGRTAADRLFGRLAGEAPGTDPVIVPTRLLVRGSSPAPDAAGGTRPRRAAGS